MREGNKGDRSTADVLLQIAAEASTDLVKIGERAGQVPAQAGLRLVGVAPGDRIDNGGVIRHHGVRLAGDRQVQAAQAIQVAALAAHQHPQVRHPRGFVHLAVECLVEQGEFGEILRREHGLLPRHAKAQPLDQRRVGFLRQGAHDFHFHRTPQEMRLLRQGDADGADHGGVLRKDIDQPFLAEPHQRVAHRRLADAVLRGQLGTRQHRAGGQRHRDDHVPHMFEHLRRGMPRAVELEMHLGRGQGGFHLAVWFQDIDAPYRA